MGILTHYYKRLSSIIMNVPSSHSPLILPYQTRQPILTRKIKLANFFAVISMIALAPIFYALLPELHDPSPVVLITRIVFLALTTGAALFAVRFAQTPYKITAFIPLLFCVLILILIIYMFLSEFDENWNKMVDFWGHRAWFSKTWQ